MPSEPINDFSPLEQAVSTWNGLFLGTYGGLMRKLSEATEDVQRLHAQLHDVEPVALPDIIHRHALDALQGSAFETMVQDLSGQTAAMDEEYEAILEALPAFEEQLQLLLTLTETWRKSLSGLLLEKEASTLPDEKRRLMHGELSTAREHLALLDLEKKDMPAQASADQQEQHSPKKKEPLGALLVASGLISAQQLDQALMEQENSWHRHLGAILVEKHYASEEDIAKTLAKQLSLTYSVLEDEKVHPQAVAALPGKLVFRHTCMPLRIEEDFLVVAMANPLDLVALEDIALLSQRMVKPIVASARMINYTIRKYYPNIL